MGVPTWVKTGLAVSTAALLSARAARPDSRWYRNLDKPAWQPPRQAFPVVWTILYGLLAYAGARAIDATSPDKRRSFQLSYVTNLGLNAGWTAVFSAARRPNAALAGITALNASDQRPAVDDECGQPLLRHLPRLAQPAHLRAEQPASRQERHPSASRDFMALINNPLPANGSGQLEQANDGAPAVA